MITKEERRLIDQAIEEGRVVHCVTGARALDPTDPYCWREQQRIGKKNRDRFLRLKGKPVPQERPQKGTRKARPGRPVREEEIAEMQRMRLEGKTIASIAKAVGRSPSVVSRHT